ncbi:MULTISPECIES: hypothetical protein [unclassified Pseudomonas]|uniref:hypothetical protein n=1 Tax=unclassified Pseudomonas TaxID=196821 RepID=UPI0025EE8A90|nr:MULTISPECIES: hypothetical protein [unclassified Pseudomonas]
MRSVAVAVAVATVMALLMAIQQIRMERLQGNLAAERVARQAALDASLQSQATITTLRAEAKRNADYQADLNKRLKASDQKALRARRDFEQLKRTRKPVRDWAAQPLPDGLRGKTARGVNDNDRPTRAP